jgi:hypothetical protein
MHNTALLDVTCTIEYEINNKHLHGALTSSRSCPPA